jgi:hypothetical protein
MWRQPCTPDKDVVVEVFGMRRILCALVASKLGVFIA